MSTTELATFGAGCFWGVQAILSKVPGIINTTAGYSGGDESTAEYKAVCTGRTGHTEVVQVEFDPSIISYEEVLSYYIRLHDPTTLNKQGVDEGFQYRSVIYTHSDAQKKIATDKMHNLNQSKKYNGTIVTAIEDFPNFFPAEDYHQDYYLKKYAGGSGPICHFLRDEE